MSSNEGQLVTFHLADEELALPIELVQEIVRPPAITKVPNTPHYVQGISNLRGNILPIINLRERLGMEVKETDEATRIVVLDADGRPTGVIVDSVSEVLHIDDKIIEAPPDTVAGMEGQYLKGVAKIDNGKRLVLILAVQKLIPQVEGFEAGREGRSTQAAQERVQKKVEDEELMVTFKLEQEEFAIEIMKVQEIIRLSEITSVPKAPHFVKGVMSLRNRLLPIIDLRVMFDMPVLAEEAILARLQDEDEIDPRRIVVIDMGGVLIGVQVDSVSEVLRMPKSQIEPPPSIIGNDEASRLLGVGKLDNGERLLMLLDPDKLLSDSERHFVTRAAGGNASERKALSRDENDEEVQVVCFRLMKEEFGTDIMQVQEIIRVDDITAVPRAPSFVEGIVNLRGAVLPVVDLRTRFELEREARTEQNRIIVINIGGKTTGVIVDSVSEVLRIPKKEIEDAPTVLTEEVDSRFIRGLAKLNQGKRLIILLEVDSILTNDEQEALHGVGGGAARDALPSGAKQAIVSTSEELSLEQMVADEAPLHDEAGEEVEQAETDSGKAEEKPKSGGKKGKRFI